MDPEDSAHQVALHVLRSGPVHRGAVARALGLSPGSLTRLGRPLVDAGVLVETDPVSDPATRRPTRPLDVALDRHRFVGVCVRGAEVSAVRTDLRTTVLDQASAPLPDSSPEAVAGTVAELVARLVGAGPPPAGTGVALDGRVDGAGRVLHAEALGWRTPVDLGGLVAGRTGWPVRVDADLACLTRAEHWFGLGREQASFAVLTVGAGIGYGLVVDDRVVDTGLPQLGHLPLGGAGPRCPRGHRGCAGSLLTTTAVLAAAHVAIGAPTTWAELLGGAVDGEVRPRRVVDDAAAALGRLVGVVSATTGVHQVLLGGDGADLAVVGYESLQAALDEHRDPWSRPVEITVRDQDAVAWARAAAGTAVQGFAAGPGWLAPA